MTRCEKCGFRGEHRDMVRCSRDGCPHRGVWDREDHSHEVEPERLPGKRRSSKKIFEL